MATKFLINTTRVGTLVRYAGESFDTTNDAAEIARIEGTGGVLLESTAALVTAAAFALRLRQAGSAEEAAAAMVAAAVASTTAVGVTAVQTTRQVISGAGMTGGGTLAADRTLAVGAGSGITVNGDDVAVTFGATGEMSEVAAASAAGSTAKVARIDHAHAHGAQGGSNQHTDATENESGFMNRVDKTILNSIQAGTVTLDSGEVTVSGINLSATGAIQVTIKDAGAGAIIGLAGFDTGSARTFGVGTGSFVIRAIDGSKAVIATALCVVDWFVVNKVPA